MCDYSYDARSSCLKIDKTIDFKTFQEKEN